MKIRRLGLIVLLCACRHQGRSQLQGAAGPEIEASTSIVNTTFNTSQKGGRWEATMGPLTAQKGGIVCDHVDATRFREGDYALWFVAPSDVMPALGLKTCGPNPHGGEPSCVENWSLCGRKLLVTCKPGTTWCAGVGEATLLADYKAGRIPVNDYVPDYYVQATLAKVGAEARVPEALVLYITDFCPSGHSANQKNGQCQQPQLDLSTAAFLLMSRQNEQGYIDSRLDVTVELLPAGDATPAGPVYRQRL